MSTLRTTARTHGGDLVLLLDGEIDIATEDQFHQAVNDAVETHPHGRVVLDCSRLAFIDSSGLRVLIQAYKAAKEHYSRVLIAAPTTRVAQILHVTSLDTRIPVFSTVDEALAAALETSSPS